MDELDLAVKARTSVDRSTVGALTAYARHPGRQRTTRATVQPRQDGTLEVHLPYDDLSVGLLLARPVATLEIAPAACEPVLLHGAARRLPGAGEHGELVFHIEVGVVRVGVPPVLVDEAAFSRAEPDPLRHDAAAVLAHLNGGHADALAACLRAGGHDAGFAHATRLDASGLTVVAVGGTGVRTVRLPFPRPVSELTDLPPSIGGVLRRGCGCSASGPHGTRSGP